MNQDIYSAVAAAPTLVQVCKGLVVQLDSRRCGSTQHILEWGVFGLVVRGEAGVLLLEDG